ncbi:kinase-like domain-containing protein [Mycena amicta]|nr:kinase-like domain-containing protein [Mycena amicta]
MTLQEPPAPVPAPATSGSSRALSAAVTSSHHPGTRSHEAAATARSAPPPPDVFSHPAVTAYVANHPNRPIPKFGAYYMLQTLGEGEFGKVKLGIHTKYGEEVAVKLIRREAVEKESRMAKIAREIEILDLLKHPNIVQLYDVFETDKFFGIILEFASGGELFDHILAHRYLREKDAAKLFAQLISGVWYMHQKEIVHRDLKLENLLLDRNRNLIITDFGFANHFNRSGKNDLMETMCGSPCYAAPELVNAEGLYVGTAADIWSCGTSRLAGYLPFDDDPTNPEGEDINKLYKYIATTPLTFPEQISDDACSLLSSVGNGQPIKRSHRQSSQTASRTH